MKNLLLIVFLIISLPALAQLELNWAAYYNGPGNHIDKTVGMVIDRGGSAIVTGTSFQGKGLGYRTVTIKYNPQGVEVWKKTHDYASTPKGIEIDAMDNIYVVSRYHRGLAINKYDKNGNLLWEYPLDTDGNAYSTLRMMLAPSGDLIVSTTIHRSSFGATQFILTFSFSSEGDLNWINKRESNPGSNDLLADMLLDSRGNIYLSGLTNYYYNPIQFYYIGGSALLLKLDQMGNSLWEQIYEKEFPNHYRVTSMALDIFDNVYISGFLVRSGNTSSFTIKFSSAGNFSWYNEFNLKSVSYDEATSVVVGKNHMVYVGGTSRDYPERFFVINCYHFSGVKLWSRKFEYSIDIPGSAIRISAIDQQGNLYVVGSFSKEKGNGIFILILDDLGEIIAVEKFTREEDSSDNAHGIHLDNGSLFLFGDSQRHGSATDFQLVKFENKLDQRMNQPYTTFFPNPLTDVSVLVFNGTESDYFEIEFFDIKGRKLRNHLTNQNKLLINRDDFPTGIYFYRIKGDQGDQLNGQFLVK